MHLLNEPDWLKNISPQHITFKCAFFSFMWSSNLKIPRSGILCVQLHLVKTTFYKIMRINKTFLLRFSTCHSKDSTPIIWLDNCSLFKSKGMLKKKSDAPSLSQTRGERNTVKNARINFPYTKSYNNLIFMQSRWTFCFKLLIQKTQIGNLWDNRASNGAWQREKAQKWMRSQLLRFLSSNEHKQGEPGLGRTQRDWFLSWTQKIYNHS